MSHSYWLFKSEPSTYSFADLQKDKTTNWNGVRNYQARNFLNQVKKGDLALIYHSGDERAVVGISRVKKAAYPDPDPKKKGDWVQVDIEPVKPFKSQVTLSAIKSTTSLKNLPLIKQSRLSVMPITESHFNALVALSEGKEK